jgi:hypothetical protein
MSESKQQDQHLMVTMVMAAAIAVQAAAEAQRVAANALRNVYRTVGPNSAAAAIAAAMAAVVADEVACRALISANKSRRRRLMEQKVKKQYQMQPKGKPTKPGRVPGKVPASVVRAAIKFQSLYRMGAARRALAKELQQKGVLLALPGTVQGRSGYYELFDEKPLVVEYKVDDEGTWGVVGRPMPKEVYMQTVHKGIATKRQEATKEAEKDKNRGEKAKKGAEQTPKKGYTKTRAVTAKKVGEQKKEKGGVRSDKANIGVGKESEGAAVKKGRAQVVAKNRAGVSKIKAENGNKKGQLPEEEEDKEDNKADGKGVAKKGGVKEDKSDGKGVAVAQKLEKAEGDGNEAPLLDTSLAVIKAVTKWQAAWRASKARLAVAIDAQSKGSLMALPGTIQGKSGWYTVVIVVGKSEGSGEGKQAERMACKYIVDSKGTWALVNKPVPLAIYREIFVHEKQSLAAVAKAAVKLQSIVRRIRVRKGMVKKFKEQGLLMAMPGTIQNQSGWYEIIDKDGENKVIHVEVNEGKWAIVAGPLSKVAYLEAVAMTKQDIANIEGAQVSQDERKV